MCKKSIAYLMAVIMLVSVFTFQFSTFAANSTLTVQFNNGNASTTSNSIYAKFKVTNTSSSPENLANLKLRYYYTMEENKPQNFRCDHSGMMNGSNYVDVTSKVTGTFVKMTQTTPTADYYLEVGFASDAGSIPAGGSIEVQTCASKTDWSNYNQSNDYSYKLSGSYTDWNQVTAYLSGSLVFGTEPVSENPTAPSISPTTLAFDKYVPADLTVTLTPNGNTFSGITGLTQGTDYTVSGNTVTILKSYLSTLAVGTKELTFNFGVASNPVLTVTISNSAPISDSLSVKIGTASGTKGGTVTVPITFEDIAKVGNVGVFNFYVAYDSTLLKAESVSPGSIVINAPVNFSTNITSNTISFLFLDETIGREIITQDGVLANITFRILDNSKSIAPVTFKTGGAFGNGNMTRITKIKFVDGSVGIN